MMSAAAAADLQIGVGTRQGGNLLQGRYLRVVGLLSTVSSTS